MPDALSYIHSADTEGRYSLWQGGPTFFFPQAKDSFPVGPKGEKTPPGTVFEN
jgi:hypothetical protein